MEQAGGFECIGFCEIDKHAAAAYRAIYNTEVEVYYSDIKTIDIGNLADFDLLVGGFPCQAYHEKRISRKTEKEPIVMGKYFEKFGIKFC